MISDPKQQEITASNYFNFFASVAQKLFSFDSPKFKFQIQSEANHCIKLFQIQNNKKSLHNSILTFLHLSPKSYFHLIIPNSNSKFKVKQTIA